MVQLPENINEESEAKRAGFETIADIGKERIRKSLQKIKEENKYDFGFKVFELTDSNFRNWIIQEIEDADELQQKLEEIIDNVKEETKKENMLYELIFKLGLNPNVEIEDKEGYYRLLDGKYLISLADKIDSDLAETFLEEDPRVVVCLDKAFKGDDELKTNIALQMQSEEITFKVV
jgi:adenine-specific DNA-methyltransferase